MLSPRSDIRILFCGDDGYHERLGAVDHNSEASEISVEEISADATGRSFLLRLSGDKNLYFWSSEKSRERFSELIDKMKNLFKQRPSLSQLTAIPDSRLDSFASSLMANFISTSKSVDVKTGSSSDTSTSSSNHFSAGSSNQSFLKSRPRASPSQVGKPHPLFQGSLSPRSNAFKDGPNRSQMLRNVVREKLKRRADNSSSPLVNGIANVASSIISEGSFPPSPEIPPSQNLKSKMEHVPCLDSLNLSLHLPSSPSSVPVSYLTPLPDLPISSPNLLSPHYCWCPPPPSLQNVATPPSLPSAPDTVTLPPLSSLFPAPSSNLFLSKPPSESNELPPLDLPTILPASSFVSMSNQPQVVSFSPFIAEPIVHIPVMDVCSSGPGYLVSAGPAISSTIPLLPKLTNNPLAPETESTAEKNARETLRMLMASTPSNPQLMNVLPAVLTSVDENISFIHGKKQGLTVSGSKGLYARYEDVTAGDLKPSSSEDATSGHNDRERSKHNSNAGNQLDNNLEESERS